MQFVYAGELLRPGQIRVLIFAHDGRGLGHLRRLCRIAQVIQGDCAVLLVTGHRAASWLVPEQCEFVHLPSHDSLDLKRSRHWSRPPFWSEGPTKGRLLRRAILQTVFDAFRPDLVLMDHLPAGDDGEMYDFIEHKRAAVCYCLLRGVLESPQRLKQLILTEKGRYLLEHRYDRIVVMSDPRVVDVVRDYEFSPAIASKIQYAGYVAEPVDRETRMGARAQRGLGPSDKWVVCSGGGGHMAEELMRECCKVAESCRQAHFDIVLGPRSALPLQPLQFSNPRVRVVREDPLLPVLHAAADIVICPGGYNSLMESAVGMANIIVAPLRNDWEQREHAIRLARFLPLALLEDLSQLGDTLQQTLERSVPADRCHDLQLSGATYLKTLIQTDLMAKSNAVSLSNNAVA